MSRHLNTRFCFETESYVSNPRPAPNYVAEAGPKPLIIVSLPPKCWNFRL